jgi:hypothetical protein
LNIFLSEHEQIAADAAGANPAAEARVAPYLGSRGPNVTRGP